MKEAKEVVLACLLDPRYKEWPLSPETLAQAKAWVTEEAQRNPPETQADTIQAETACEEEGDPKRQRVGEGKAHSVLDSLYDSMLSSTTLEEEPEKIIDELERYMREPVIEKGEPTGVMEEPQFPLQGTVRPGQEIPLLSTFLCAN